jgi:DNA-binding NtrC family response regulator
VQVSKAASMRILCVITPQDVCELITVLLPEYEVVTVRTIAEAMLWLERSTFGLVISGDFLFDGTTIDLCQFVRELYPTLPVIVLAGRGRVLESDVEEAGGDELISYDATSWPEELEIAVRRLTPPLPDSA